MIYIKITVNCFNHINVDSLRVDFFNCGLRYTILINDKFKKTSKLTKLFNYSKDYSHGTTKLLSPSGVSETGDFPDLIISLEIC